MKPKRLTFKIAVFPGGTREAEGYQVSQNFAVERDPCSGWQMTHLGSGFAVPRVRPKSLRDAQADADKLEKATYPNGKKFHWEKITRENADRRVRRAGKGFLSRALGRPVQFVGVG